MRPSSNLSSSALNYLESLEKSSKELRNHKNVKGSNGNNSKPRKSISEIISQVRRQTSISRTNSDDIDLNDSFKSSTFDEESGRGEKLMMFDSDSDKELTSSRILPPGTPGMQVGRKSLKEMRELRNSIDQSLIKTPEVKKEFKKIGESNVEEMTTKLSKPFEKIEEEEEISQEIKKPTVVTKSPFKKAVESDSSDIESIIFDEVFEEENKTEKPVENEQKSLKIEEEKTRRISPKPVITEQPKPETETDSESESESESNSDSDSDSDTNSDSVAESDSSENETSTEQSKAEKSASSSETESSAESEQELSAKKSESSRSVKNQTSPETKVEKELKLENSRIYETFFPSASSINELSSENVTSRPIVEKREKEEKEKNDKKSIKQKKSKLKLRKIKNEKMPKYIDNAHKIMEQVLEDHMNHLRNLNQIEYESVQEWMKILKSFDKFDGPNSEKLKKIIKERIDKDRFNF